ncbi:hypothetical protein [Pseudomonas sp. I3-I5]|uniref:hypothetical protein n=1 Tax=Pseudomonas sp. I3-I5 TaxID=2926671 RepID=UPI001F60502F|nr:hypothetical protein [Pseudomonas sp. I3-I5]UNT15077.1 hypothetical protein MOP87_07800 [Pseudomonas sp. I3-I5]
MSDQALQVSHTNFCVEFLSGCESFSDDRLCKVDLELKEGHCMISANGRSHYLTAQQCAELAHCLGDLILHCKGAFEAEMSEVRVKSLQNSKAWCGLIQARTISEQEELLTSCTLSRGANKRFYFGDFRAFKTDGEGQNYFKISVIPDPVSLQPCIFLDGNAIYLDFNQGLRLVEYLRIAGYLTAQIEPHFECVTVGRQSHSVPGKAALERRVSYRSTRTLAWHGYGLDGEFTGSVDVHGEQVLVTLDESESVFTALQCAEIANKLATLLIIYVLLGSLGADHAEVDLINASRDWQQLIAERSDLTREETMNVFSGSGEGYEYIASYDFERKTTSVSGSTFHRVVMAFDEDVRLPCISVDHRAFNLDLDEAIWFMESLQVAAYLASMEAS